LENADQHGSHVSWRSIIALEEDAVNVLRASEWAAGARTGVVQFWHVLAKSCGITIVVGLLAPLLESSQSNLRQQLRQWCYDAKDKKGEHRQQIEVSGCFAPSWRGSKGSHGPWVGSFPNLGRQSFLHTRNPRPRLPRTKARARTRALLQLAKRPD